jgi:predicted extracellular nuclease
MKRVPYGVLAVVLALVLVAAGGAGAAGGGGGSVSLTGLGVAYTQDFNSLASSGTSSVVPNGWAFDETSTNANSTYTAGTGSSNTGDTYSFGAASSPERAFGGLQSGSLLPTIGATFVNDTGATIDSLDVAYTGEQWRVGTLGRPDRLDFQLSTNATSLATGVWTDVDSLDFTGPDQGGTVGLRNGNGAANRTVIMGSVAGLSIPSGATFWIRFSDFNASGADDGLAFDDFSVTPQQSGETRLSVNDVTVAEGDAGTSTATFTVSLSRPAPAGGVTFDIATSDGTATASSGDYVARSVAGATIPAGSTSYSFPVTVNGDTNFEPDETFAVDVTNVSGATVADGHGIGTIRNDDEAPPVPIHDIQGASHSSPLNGQIVNGVAGIVTARTANGFFLEDPNADSNDATSEGIFVFTSSAPAVTVGDSVKVTGRVNEFRPGGATTGNLTTTEIGSPTVTVVSSGNPLPAPIVLGNGGRIPPSEVIEDDASSGNVETSGVFDPQNDGLDFYESVEGMRVQLNNAIAVGPTATGFGETPVVADNGANTSVRTARGGVLLRQNDGNPERIIADDRLTPLPALNVGDGYDGPLVGVVDYNFGNFFLEVTQPVGRVDNGLKRETTTAPGPNELTAATFNFENLDPTDPQSKFDQLAIYIVENLRSPDLIGGEEVQDNTGPADNGTVDASVTLTNLVAAIQAAGGPHYDWREIDPVNDQDGGEPGGNIRQVFQFRTDRGLSFVDRPGGNATTPTGVTGSGASTQLTLSPGRIDPNNPNGAWASSRKPLAGEFLYRGQKVFAIVNHFNSKGGDDPLSGRFQPPVRSSEEQRHKQATIVGDFVSQLTQADPNANVIVLGDLNDFEFSETVTILKNHGLHDFIETLPLNQRYSYEFEGNAQVLDHIMGSDAVLAHLVEFDAVHVNAEFADQASDHDPSVIRVLFNRAPTVSAGGPYSVDEGGSTTVTASGSDPDGDAVTYAWDLDDNGSFETPGQSATFSAASIDGPATRTISVRATDSGGASSVASATVNVANVAPSANAGGPYAGTPYNPVTFAGSASDPAGPRDTLTYAWDFDYNGTFAADESGVDLRNPSHAYASPGTYTVALQVTDDDGGASQLATATVVIATPASTGGKVEGSPKWERDIKTKLNVDGKKDGEIKGRVQFDGDGHDYDSTRLDSIVVTGSDATVYGAFGSITFRLDVHDGGKEGADTLRLRTSDGYDSGVLTQPHGKLTVKSK